MTKNYGDNVSRVLIDEDTSLQQVIFQKGKPTIDSEFNAAFGFQNEIRASILRKTTPSGWLTYNGISSTVCGKGIISTKRSNPISGMTTLPYYTLIFGSNSTGFNKNNSETAIVNGWEITVGGDVFGSEGLIQICGNIISFNSSPVTDARLDFAYLEVWQALIDPAVTTNVYPYGNMNPNFDNTIYYTDQIIEPSLNIETTKRVQIQYRIRTHSNCSDINNPFSTPDLYAIGPNNSPSIFNFAPVENDPGLWASIGDIDGTVDGKTYAIPICVVHRRNSNQYNYLTNPNGASYPGTGIAYDRPDRLNSFWFEPEDITDLRHHINLNNSEFIHKAEQAMDKILLGNYIGNTPSGDGEGTPTNVFGSKLLTLEGVSVVDRDNIIDIFEPDGIRKSFCDIPTTYTTYHWLNTTTNYVNSIISYDSSPSQRKIRVRRPTLPVGVTFTKINIKYEDGTDLVLNSENGPGPGSVNYIAILDGSEIVVSRNFYLELIWSIPGGFGSAFHFREVLAATGSFESLGNRQIGFANNKFGASINNVFESSDSFIPLEDIKAIDYAATTSNINVQTVYPQSPTPSTNFNDIGRDKRGSWRQLRIKSAISSQTIIVPKQISDLNVLGVFLVTEYFDPNTLTIYTDDNPQILKILEIQKFDTYFQITVDVGIPDQDVFVYVDTDSPVIVYSETAKSILTVGFIQEFSIIADGTTNIFYLENIPSEIRGIPTFLVNKTSYTPYVFVDNVSTEITAISKNVNGAFYLEFPTNPPNESVISFYISIEKALTENETLEIYHRRAPFYGKNTNEEKLEVLEICDWIISSLATREYPYYGESTYPTKTTKFFVYNSIIPEFIKSEDVFNIFNLHEYQIQNSVVPKYMTDNSSYGVPIEDAVVDFMRYKGPFFEGFNNQGRFIKQGMIIDTLTNTVDGLPFNDVFAFQKQNDSGHVIAIPMVVKTESGEVKLALLLNISENRFVKFGGGVGTNPFVSENLKQENNFTIRIFDLPGKPLIK